CDYRSPKNNLPSSLLPGEQIGAALACARHRLLPAPLRDLRVVAGEEHVRNAQTAEVGRPRILRPLEKPVAGKALRLCGKLVAQHTRHETRNGVGHAMLAFGEVADVGHPHAQQALLAGLREDALLERRRDHARKQGEHFDRQHGYSSRSNKPSGASTTIRRACGCTSVTRANGTSTPPSSLSRSCGPASSRSSTTPRTVPCESDTW